MIESSSSRNALTGINRILTELMNKDLDELRASRNALTGINRILTLAASAWLILSRVCRNALTGINRILTVVLCSANTPRQPGGRNALTGINRILTSSRARRSRRSRCSVVMPLRALIGF